MSTLKCAVIGVGHLGNFHAQKFANSDQSELVAVCDVDQARCDEMASQHNTSAVYDYRELIGKVDAVSIVVPTALHYEIAQFFLDHKVHCLVEKPFTSNLDQADHLIALAKARHAVLQVGHIERFNPVLVALDKVIKRPGFIESSRLAPFKPRGTDINVILDVMIHDIDILTRIVGSPITEVHASGTPVLTDMIDIVNARLKFESGCVANVTASRVSFKAERKLRIFQPDAYISLDLNEKKFAVHRKGKNQMFPGIPDITSEEQQFGDGDALQDEIESFLTCIQTGQTPKVTGEDGRQALATAIEITQMVRQQVQDFLRETELA